MGESAHQHGMPRQCLTNTCLSRGRAQFQPVIGDAGEPQVRKEIYLINGFGRARTGRKKGSIGRRNAQMRCQTKATSFSQLIW